MIRLSRYLSPLINRRHKPLNRIYKPSHLSGPCGSPELAALHVRLKVSGTITNWSAKIQHGRR